jgi:hypothetical protein
MSEEDEWPPPAARVRAALWRAEGHIERREYFAASDALAPVFGLEGEEQELVRGLHHLAAAGYRHQIGDDDRARRQLEHARRRLESHPEVMPLLRLVEADVES